MLLERPNASSYIKMTGCRPGSGAGARQAASQVHISYQAIAEAMTFVKTDCPECGERILLDVANGYGYCMYCGAKVAPEGLVLLPSPLRVTLRRELDADDPYAGRPWYGRVCDAGDMLRSGDPEGAASAVREAFAMETDEGSRADIVDAVDAEIIETIVSVIDSQDPVPYRGGMRAVFDVCDEEAGMGLTTRFMDLCLLQFSMEAGRAKDEARVGAMIVSIAYLVRDYLSMVRRPEDVYKVLVTSCSIMQDLADGAYPEDYDDGRFDDREDIRCMMMLMHLSVLFSMELDRMSQKELVRLNRSIATKDPSGAMSDLDEAYSKLTSPDKEAFMEPMERYADFMLYPDNPTPRKAARKAKKRGCSQLLGRRTT